MQNEVNAAVSALDDRGNPQNFGWSRQPVFFYDPSLVWAARRSISESDRYIVFNPAHIAVFEIRDDGYLGHMGVTIVSIKEKKRITRIFQTVLPLGSYDMPSGSQNGAIRYRRKKNSLDFVPMEGKVRIIKVDIPVFAHRRNLRGKLVLTEPASAESLVTNLPWRDGKNTFRYSRSSPWFTVEGVIQLGTTEIIFSGGNSWGIFDWSRGVRPRSGIRSWASACGLAGNRLVGFSVGYGSIDSEAGTENAFFTDGRLHKLDQVTFHTPSDWLAPWRFTSNDNRLEMTFSPLQERLDRRQAFFHLIARRQVCGYFSGKVILDDGDALGFKNLTGFVEQSRTRF